MSVYNLPQKENSEDPLCFYDGFKLESKCPEVIAGIKAKEVEYQLKQTLYQDTLLYIRGEWQPHSTKACKVDFKIQRNNQRAEVVHFTGSFHKLFENGTNYKPFTWKDFLSVAESIVTEFGLKSSEVRVINLECGLNAPVPPEWGITAKSIARNSYVLKGKGIKKTENFDELGFIKRFEKDQYCVKIYDKSMQNNLSGTSILRFELKYLASKKLRSDTGIVSLSDLKNFENHNMALRKAIDLMDHLVIFQEELLELVEDKKELEFIKRLSTEKQWEDLHKAGTTLYHNTRNKYEQLLDKYCKYNYRKELKQIMLRLACLA